MDRIPKGMEKGSQGVSVLILQIYLFGCCLGKKLILDGVFGDETEASVMEFQGDYKLDGDGKVGQATRQRIKELDNFDFELACTLIPGKTIFVVEGEEIEWTSPAGLPTEMSQEEAAASAEG